MGRMYRATFGGIASTAAQDLFEILAATGKTIIIHRWSVSQSSDAKDIEEEVLRLRTVRGEGSVTSGSGGSSVTPAPINKSDTATGATVERNNTTQMAAGSGALVTMSNHTWNNRSEFDMVYLPEERPVISPGDRWTLELVDAPLDSLTMNATVTFEEVG